jgi:hypothetical protein
VVAKRRRSVVGFVVFLMVGCSTVGMDFLVCGGGF